MAGGLNYVQIIWVNYVHTDIYGGFLNRGTPKSCILMGLSLINHPFGGTPILGNPHMNYIQFDSHACVYNSSSTISHATSAELIGAPAGALFTWKRLCYCAVTGTLNIPKTMENHHVYWVHNL